MTGFSPPNALMFNDIGQYPDGGVPRDPETIVFQIPMTHVHVNVAHGGGTFGHLWMRGYDAAWNLVDSSDIQLSDVLTTISVEGSAITFVYLFSNAHAWLLDDLEAH